MTLPVWSVVLPNQGLPVCAGRRYFTRAKGRESGLRIRLTDTCENCLTTHGSHPGTRPSQSTLGRVEKLRGNPTAPPIGDLTGTRTVSNYRLSRSGRGLLSKAREAAEVWVDRHVFRKYVGFGSGWGRSGRRTRPAPSSRSAHLDHEAERCAEIWCQEWCQN